MQSVNLAGGQRKAARTEGVAQSKHKMQQGRKMPKHSEPAPSPRVAYESTITKQKNKYHLGA